MDVSWGDSKRLPFVIGMILGIGMGGLLADIIVGRAGLYGYLVGWAFNALIMFLFLYYEYQKDKKHQLKYGSATAYKGISSVDMQSFTVWTYTCPKCSTVMAQTPEPPIISDIGEVQCESCKQTVIPQISSSSPDLGTPY